ncbi:MAG: YdcF family protein [Nanoarchaeota archaeon]|nr:YdcF family protein [Nanoarchaeota archaeon]
MLKQIEPTKYEELQAKRIWNYMILNHKLKKSDLIMVLGSIDLLPARRAAHLYKKDYAPLILFSGGAGGRNYSLLRNNPKLISEAKMLALEAIKYGIPRRAVILEEESTNTGENAIFSKKLLERLKIQANRIIVVHMPSSLRRDYCTLKKQWAGMEFIMDHPKIDFEEYHKEGYQGTMSRSELISDMLGDFQRLFVHTRPEFGYIFSQKELKLKEPSIKVIEAYKYLISQGYGKGQLVLDKKTLKPYEIF